MRKLVSMFVISVWVFAQTLTAANSSAHMAPVEDLPVHSAHHAMAGHGMQSEVDAPTGHDKSSHAVHCPASGAKKAPAGSPDGNCCDHANCHVADLVLGGANIGTRHIEVFETDAQRSHVVWVPASPLPPPNPRS